MSRWCITLVVLITCYGCQLPAHSKSEAVPALLTEISQADRQQIILVVGDALNRESKNILLGSSIFTHTHILIVQRKPDKSNPHLYGLSLDRPDNFALLKDSQGCLIHHRQSDRQWRLENLQCAPIAPSQ